MDVFPCMINPSDITPFSDITLQTYPCAWTFHSCRWFASAPCSKKITQFCWKYSSSIQQWKNFENRLRFEKVIAKSLVASFFWNPVHMMLVIHTCREQWI